MSITPTAKPYLVKWRNEEGAEFEERVIAYDIQEAIYSTSILISGRMDSGSMSPSIISIEPDQEALAAGLSGAVSEMVELIRSGRTMAPEGEQ